MNEKIDDHISLKIDKYYTESIIKRMSLYLF